MSDHEELHEHREEEAERLADRNERVEQGIDESRAAVERAQADDLIPAPEGDEPGDGGAEADYPTKD